MIYPSGRAVVLTGAAAIPAIAVALAVPQYWYAGLALVVLLLALTIADALGMPGPKALDATLDAPRAAFVGQGVTLDVSASGMGGARRFEALVEHDDKLKPLPFRSSAQSIPRIDQDGPNWVGVGSVNESGAGFFRTDPNPSPEGEGLHSFTAVRRGSAALEALWLRWPGMFGLVWRQKRVALDRKIAVLPDLRPARATAVRLFRRDADIGELVQIQAGASGEFQSLAEFRSGMDRRAIDWKASARHNNLIAREYRTERNNDIVFAVDAGRLMCEPVAGVPRIDRAISAALTAAFVALKLGDKVSLFGFDAHPRISSGAVSGIASFGTFQRLAAELDYSNEETNFTLALTTLGAELKRRSLVLVFTDFVDPTSAELMLKTVGRLAERHLVLFVLMHDVELDALANAAPETADDVSRAVIAAAMQRERRIVVARLQRLGVHIVEAHHDRLGPELVNAYLRLKKRNLL